MAMMVGESVRLTAGRLDLLHECDRPAPAGVRWTTSDTVVATVGANAMLRALAPGRIQAVARARGSEASLDITVVPQISALRFTPAQPSLSVGDSLLVSAVALDGTGAVVPEATLNFLVTRRPAFPDRTGQLAVANDHRQPPPNSLWVRGARAGDTYLIGRLVGFRDSIIVNIAPQNRDR